MEINIEQLKKEGSQFFEEIIAYKDRETNDVLIESVDKVEAKGNALLIDENEFHISIQYIAYVKYLDARNLNPLKLKFEFSDDIIFTSDSRKAENFELEYFEGDTIFLDDILFDLTCVRIPLNYSEDDSGQIIKESELEIENKPFADIFNK